MKFIGPLLVVKDIDKAVEFYNKVLGLEVIIDFGANKTLTGGFSLQTLDTWVKFIHKNENEVKIGHNAAELYFEEDNMDAFLCNLKSFSDIEYIHDTVEHSWGQRAIRFYDFDKNIIEVGENLDAVIMRFINSGMTIEQTAKRMDIPADFILQTINRINEQTEK